MNTQKRLKDLNLLDRFLFSIAMEDPEIVENVLEIILGKEVVLKHLPQPEKEKRSAIWSKQIKLDVWAMDTDDNIYDTEVQNRNTYNLPKRTRYYNALIDSDSLESGTVDYNELNDVYIIMIMPFDLFGKGLYKYTFRMTCDEIPELKLNDGATRIFLNTKGTDSQGISQELIDLLNYFEHTTSDVAESSTGKKILKMQQKIQSLKENEEIGVKYMNAWEEKILDKREARAEGLAEGLAEGHKEKQLEIIKKMLLDNAPKELILKYTSISQDELNRIIKDVQRELK